MNGEPDPIELIEPPDRRSWRAWLERNHRTRKAVCLILSKKGAARPTVTYGEAMEEAIAFGWIDSRGNRLDRDRFKLIFTPRKPGGVWAPSNKARVARLAKAGLMAPAGLAAVARAKRDGSWSFYDDIERLRYPEDLKRALAASKRASQFFDGSGMTYRKQALYWIASAKRPETREKRIAKVARLAAAGKKADWYYSRPKAGSPVGVVTDLPDGA
ncbi:MAG: hypothetical protein FJ149_04400 [Euryarchaeota archaeon]|nr:hypothetical protein [Euryarchaeota archaeon]